jgi:hypothetical protein
MWTAREKLKIQLKMLKKGGVECLLIQKIMNAHEFVLEITAQARGFVSEALLGRIAKKSRKRRREKLLIKLLKWEI